MNFKKGDVVECVDSDGSNLELGQEYLVASAGVAGDWVELVDLRGLRQSYRFMLVYRCSNSSVS